MFQRKNAAFLPVYLYWHLAAIGKVDKLSERISALETAGVKYRGVWPAAEEYRRGDMDARMISADDAIRFGIAELDLDGGV